MASIQAFRAIRYDLGHVGNLSDVVAPPYDVIDSDLQDELYQRHPANVVRLILNRSEPGDPEPDIRYDRAARFLRNWLREGVLQQEPRPAIYVYQQEFSFEGQSCKRTGFMCRVQLEPFGTGKIFPHEETHSAAKADRLKLTRACRANLSPVFGLYPDDGNHVVQLFLEAVRGMPAWEAIDHLGVVHRLWAVTDLTVIGRVASLMQPKSMFIADGHHRYETACNYRDERREADVIGDEHPANFVLMMCVGMSDPGMVVLPTHRLFRGLSELNSDELVERLGNYCTCRVVGEGSDLASSVWEEILAEDRQDIFGFFTDQDQRWILARVTEAGHQRMTKISSDRSAAWRSLGVSILQRLVVECCLQSTDLPKPMYVHSINEVIQGIETGDRAGRDATGQEGQGGRFPLVALVMPASLEHVRTISESGERMPAKSTYFYPKLLSGLVINPLDP